MRALTPNHGMQPTAARAIMWPPRLKPRRSRTRSTDTARTMKQPAEPTLSLHLLKQAAKFFFYPHSARPSRGHLFAVQTLDEFGHRHLEWRKTFAPQPMDSITENLFDPVFLDELYSRQLLREVPGMVDRTRSLAHLTLVGITGETFVYLREAANCYIAGLDQAAVALARAAVEVPLKRAVSKRFGARAVEDVGLFKLIEMAGRSRWLSPSSVKLAHIVRDAGDEVLHEKPVDSDEVLRIIEAARSVVGELVTKAG